MKRFNKIVALSLYLKAGWFLREGSRALELDNGLGFYVAELSEARMVSRGRILAVGDVEWKEDK